MSRRSALAALAIVLLIALVWALFVALPRRVEPGQTPTTSGGETGTPAERRITATLYFISEDGLSLVGAPREVPFGEPATEQARHIVEAQLGAPPAPLAAAVPDGTRLLSLFISEPGDAFVNLSGEVRTNHSGGSLNELFTVYAIVNALTVNLPAIARVQILIDGEEVDTLAGHVDLRHPLRRSLKWMDEKN